MGGARSSRRAEFSAPIRQEAVLHGRHITTSRLTLAHASAPSTRSSNEKVTERGVDVRSAAARLWHQ
jgi:hypothetical protein